jgi:hypothetical protein
MEKRLWQFVFISLAIKYDSPDYRQEVITSNMVATKQENVFCVMDYAQWKSVATVQRNTRTRFLEGSSNQEIHSRLVS